jgi:hypothetical protein
MAGVECPKCGRATEDGAIICPGCDFILDASFLGDDITDDERDRRPRRRDAGRATKAPSAPARVDFGEDAMILGNLDGVEVSSFNSRDAGLSQREVTQTRFYIGGAVAQLMEPNAIPEVAAGVAGASIRMTPFERHVLGFVNGRRSIGRIQKKSAMEDSEFKTAVAMLADKGFIRLKGWKKPRAASASTMTGPSMTGASLTGSSVAPPAPREAERTVVASMAHIEAVAQQQKEARRPPRPARAPVPEAVSALDTPPAPMPSPAITEPGGADEVATRIIEVPTVSRPAAVPSRRFASLQAEAPSAGEESAPTFARPIEPTGAHDDVGAADAWGAEDNQSSVFADSGAPPRPARPPSLADVAPTDDIDSFAPGQTGAIEAFRDPTGIGDSPPGDGDVGDMGAPVEDDDDPPFASAEALDDERLHANDDADGLVGPTDHDAVDALGHPRRSHDEVTAAPPRAPSLADQPVEDVGAPDGFDDGDAATADPTGQHPRPMTLPSSALSPAVIEPPPCRPPVTTPVLPMDPPPTPPAPAAPPVVAPPGQALVSPGAPVAPVVAPPGQALVTPQSPPPSPTTPPAPAMKPAAPTRVSATSQVPFELRKKAERIYEQALKDQAEGRISSAMMNAKLAMNFDPTVDAYRELHEDLARQKAAPKGPRPQELVLFEQASEAEGKGDYEKAVKLLEQAIAINPRASALYNRLGVVLSIRLKRHEEALAHLKKAIELEPGSIVYMNNFSKVTGLLESLIQKGPRKNKKQKADGPEERVAVKKIRPKMF